MTSRLYLSPPLSREERAEKQSTWGPLFCRALYSARLQNALLETEQRTALGCTSLCSTVLPSNPFPVGHPAVGQSTFPTGWGSEQIS